MRERNRGAFATPLGIRHWDERRIAKGLSLVGLKQLSEKRKAHLSVSTLRRIRGGENTDRILDFFRLVDIEAVEGVHYEVSTATAAGVESVQLAHSMGAVERFEALTSEERSLAAALTIFAAGWTEESGSAIVGDHSWSCHDFLLRKGVVREQRDRFEFVEAFRPLAERTAHRREIASTHADRHARYFAAQAARHSDQVVGPEEQDAVRWFVAEHQNVFKSLRYFSTNDFESANDLAVDVGMLTLASELYEEGKGALETILERWNDPSDPRYVRLLGCHAKLVFRTFEIPRARRLLKRALRVAQATDDAVVQIECHMLLGGTGPVKGRGKLHPRRRAMTEARNRAIMDILEQTELPAIYQARAFFNLAISEFDGTSSERFANWAEESYRLAVESGNLEIIASSLALLGDLDRWETRYDGAIHRLQEAIQVCERNGRPFRLYWAVKSLGETFLDAGHFREAARYFRRARALSYAIQNPNYPLVSGFLAALALALDGQLPESENLFQDAANEAATHSLSMIDDTSEFLCVVAIIAKDPRVRKEALIALKPNPHFENPKSSFHRREHVRKAASIDLGTDPGTSSVFDGLPSKLLLQDLSWLCPEGFTHLDRLRRKTGSNV